MSDTHDWHMFDAERGYEARQLGPDLWELRWWPEGADKPQTRRLDRITFDQFRSANGNPAGIP